MLAGAEKERAELELPPAEVEEARAGSGFARSELELPQSQLRGSGRPPLRLV